MFQRRQWQVNDSRKGSLARSYSWIALLGLVLLTSCAAAPGNPAPAYSPPTSVSSSVTLARPSMPAAVEFDLLERNQTAPALLRRAFLALELHRPQEALDDAGEVLYGPKKPSANEEAFARFLRAAAFAQQGMPERGQYDRERAAVLTLDLQLRQRLQSAIPIPPEQPRAIADVDLVVTDRSDWNAKTPRRKNMDPMGSISRLTIHHSAMFLRDTRPSACAAQIQRIQMDHMQTRGYGDIGYHYLIDPSGRIWEGRDLQWQGAHASGDHNVGNIGICLLGNFMPGRKGHKPSQLQVTAMERLVAQLLRRHQLGANDIYCHSHFKNTECPGELMEPVVAQLIRNMQRKGVTGVAAAAADH